MSTGPRPSHYLPTSAHAGARIRPDCSWSACTRMLVHPLVFVAARHADAAAETVPYAPLRDDNGRPSSAAFVKMQRPPSQQQQQQKASSKPNEYYGMTLPSMRVSDTSQLRFAWPSVRGPAAGLVNLGNTCFLNATLQCLTHTPALAAWLSARSHTAACTRGGFCVACALERHVCRALAFPQPAAPKHILSHLKGISQTLRWGRQEDAHEFLRMLFDAVQRAIVEPLGRDAARMRAEETTPLFDMFGGYGRSTVTCLSCGNKSHVYEPMLDLLVTLHGGASLQALLSEMARPDVLEGDNAYSCSKCGRRVPKALKEFRVHKAPQYLTVVLKRFQYMNRHGGKIGKFVEFSEQLSLRHCMSPELPESVRDGKYRLYAVLVHDGYSIDAGHYYSFVRAANDLWFCMNDSHVSQVSAKTVLAQPAYLLFYARAAPPTALHAQPGAPRSGAAPAAGVPVTTPVAAQAPAAGAARASAVVPTGMERVLKAAVNTTATIERLQAAQNVQLSELQAARVLWQTEPLRVASVAQLPSPAAVITADQRPRAVTTGAVAWQAAPLAGGAGAPPAKSATATSRWAREELVIEQEAPAQRGFVRGNPGVLLGSQVQPWNESGDGAAKAARSTAMSATGSDGQPLLIFRKRDREDIEYDKPKERKSKAKQNVEDWRAAANPFQQAAATSSGKHHHRHHEHHRHRHGKEHRHGEHGGGQHRHREHGGEGGDGGGGGGKRHHHHHHRNHADRHDA